MYRISKLFSREIWETRLNISFACGLRLRVIGPSTRIVFSKWKEYTRAWSLVAKNRWIIQSLEFNEHSRMFDCSVVEFCWLFSPSSIPLGHAVRLMVVSCSLIGPLVLVSFPKMDMCMVFRWPRRESYLLELINEKLWPRPRELKSDEQRRRLRILLGTQQSRYLQRSLLRFNDFSLLVGCNNVSCLKLTRKDEILAYFCLLVRSY